VLARIAEFMSPFPAEIDAQASRPRQKAFLLAEGDDLLGLRGRLHAGGAAGAAERKGEADRQAND
jgi:hypothetical protein